MKRKQEQRDIARATSSGIAESMAVAVHWPVSQARVSATLWEKGIGHAMLVRRGPNGLAAMTIFLLDVYCLGVKNVFARVAPDYEIAGQLSRMNENSEPWLDVSPEHVRKLVEEALGYALSLGLAPHHDCPAAMKIFGDLDVSKCTKEFTFGFEGQPHFFAGPYDTPARILEILKTLRRTCGLNGFHYTVPIDSPELSDELAEVLENTDHRILNVSEKNSDVAESPV